MSLTHKARQYETALWTFTLRDADGVVSLSDTPTIKAYFRERNGSSNVIDGTACSIVGDGTAGQCTLAPSDAHVATARTLYGHFTVDRGGGIVEMYPSDEEAKVTIRPSYSPAP